MKKKLFYSAAFSWKRNKIPYMFHFKTTKENAAVSLFDR